MTKYYIAAFVVAVAIVGGYFFPKVTVPPFGSSAGAVFSTAKVAAVNINPQSRTSTSTSILNSDSSDRVVTDGFVACYGLTSMNGSTGAGLATDNWTAATTSVAAPTATIASAPFAAFQFSLGTTTTFNEVATSSYAVPWGQIWTTGTYMTFQTNATSTATTCTVGVHYFGT